MNYLVVVAHPDDEVLGAGATIKRLNEEKNNVAVCIMVGKAGARANLSDTLQDDEASALQKLGVQKVLTQNHIYQKAIFMFI
jgi:LmbE family N-acetylglucosaminyl deacetylase